MGRFFQPSGLRNSRMAQQTSSSSTRCTPSKAALSGLTPTAAQTHVQPGEAYVNGNRLRLRANRAIDLAGLTRPTGNRVAWVTVLASYTTAQRHDRDRSIRYAARRFSRTMTSSSRCCAAPTRANPRPSSRPYRRAQSRSVTYCWTARRRSARWTATSHAGRSAPPMNCAKRMSCYGTAIRAIQATLAATLQSPDKGPTPSATSTDALQVDATWAAGTVPTGAPAIDKAKFRQRQAGENWADSRTTTLGDVQEYSFDVPDADSDVQMQVQYGNDNGFGAWSNTGTIDAGDIEEPPGAGDAHLQHGGRALADVAVSAEHARAGDVDRRVRAGVAAQGAAEAGRLSIALQLTAASRRFRCDRGRGCGRRYPHKRWRRRRRR